MNWFLRKHGELFGRLHQDQKILYETFKSQKLLTHLNINITNGTFSITFLNIKCFWILWIL